MENLIDQGLELAILGMGTVFVFLTLLIFVTRFMSFLVLRFEPAPEAAPIVRQGGSEGDSRVTLAVITAAITQHRRKNK